MTVGVVDAMAVDRINLRLGWPARIIRTVAADPVDRDGGCPISDPDTEATLGWLPAETFADDRGLDLLQEVDANRETSHDPFTGDPCRSSPTS